MQLEIEEREGIGRKAARTFYSSLIGKVAGAAITIATLVIFARMLGTAGYGLLTLALAYATFVGSSGHFGVASYFNKYIAGLSRKREVKELHSILASGYVLLIFAATLIAIAGIVFSNYVATTFYHSVSLEGITLILASLDIAFGVFWGSSYAALIGFGEGKTASLSLIGLNTLQLAVGAALIIYGYGVNGAMLGIAFGDLFGMIVMTYAVYATLGRYGREKMHLPSRKSLWKMLTFTGPLTFYNIIIYGMQNFGTLFLGLYATATVLGNYGTATKALGIIPVVFGLLSMVTLQAFSAVFSEKRRRKGMEVTYNKVLMYSVMLSLPLVVFVIVFAKPLIYFFLGSAFSEAPVFLELIAFGALFNNIAAYISSFFIAAERVKQILLYTLVAGILQLVVMVTLVPSTLAYGAIFAIYYVGGFSTIIMYTVSLKRHFGIRLWYRKLLSAFVSAMMLGVLASIILGLGNYVEELVLGAACIALLYPPLLVVFKALNREVLGELRGLSEKVPVLELMISLLCSYSNIFINILDTK